MHSFLSKICALKDNASMSTPGLWNGTAPATRDGAAVCRKTRGREQGSAGRYDGAVIL